MTKRQRTHRALWVGLGLLMLGGLVALISLSIMTSSESARTSRENQGYVRYLACVAEIRNSRNVIAIDKATSDFCWEEAQAKAGVTLTRYSEIEVQNALGR